MRVRALVMTLLLTATLVQARPSRTARAKQPAPPPNALALAEQYFQRGAMSEAMSAMAWQVWVQTINVGPRDVWANQEAFAADMYANSVRLNPAHWRAHKRLGQLYARTWGTHAHDELAILHLAAYLALKPDDVGVLDAKDRVDELIDRYIARQGRNAQRAEGQIRHALEDADVKNAVRGELVKIAEELSRGGMGDMSGPAFGDPGDYRGVPEEAHGVVHAATSGFLSSRPETGGLEMTPAMEDFERGVLQVANYVSNYLYLMGTMHRFMHYCDTRRVAYDPRLPEGLIGESVAQLRMLYTGHFRRGGGGLQWVQQEYTRYAQLGTIEADDLWTTRDYTKPLPQAFVAAGTLEEPERNAAVYEVLRTASVVSLPDYDTEAEEDQNETRLAAADAASHAGWTEYVNWREQHLRTVAEGLGLADADEVFVRDYVRLGSGEIGGWTFGSLAPAARLGELPGDRAWLFAAAP